MPAPVHCDVCDRYFKSFQCFQQHLDGGKNRKCAESFVGDRLKPIGGGLVRYRGKVFQTCRLDVQQFVGRAAEILNDEKVRSEKAKAADLSELEFKAVDENPPPQKQIRIGELRRMGGSATVSRKEPLVRGRNKKPARPNLPLMGQWRRQVAERETLEESVEPRRGNEMPSGRNPNDMIGIPANEPAGIEGIGDGPTAEEEEDVEAEEEAQKAPDMRPLQQFKECIERAKKINCHFHRKWWRPLS